MPNDELIMKFDPSTIQHLGIQMYSQIPKVLAELVSNAYDADAEKVIIKLIENDEDGGKKIVITDDGIGLSFSEINEEFLMIGRNRREEGSGTTQKGRKVMGKKGIGKLAFFGIAEQITIMTKRNGLRNAFKMDWNEIKNATGEYKPEIIAKDKECNESEHETEITLTGIKISSKFKLEEYAKKLARLFIITEDFEIIIWDGKQKRIKVSNKPCYEDLDLQFTWNITDDLPDRLNHIKQYCEEKGINGKLFTAESPIKPKLELGGIILFSRKKMVSAPSYFSSSESSYFFSYFTGYLNIDFIDDLEDDVISTDRQSLIGDNPEVIILEQNIAEIIKWISVDWREKRKKEKRNNLIKHRIDAEHWYGTMDDKISKKLETLVNTVTDAPEFSNKDTEAVIKILYNDIIPEYPDYHWRSLHNLVQDYSESYYKNKDYFTAVYEVAKKYKKEVKKKLKENGENKGISDTNLMSKAFGVKKPLQVTKKYNISADEDFEKSTKKNIEDAQMHFSEGVVKGCRNPMSHEFSPDLKKSNLFNDKDCLNLLSLLSYLFRRLDDV